MSSKHKISLLDFDQDAVMEDYKTTKAFKRHPKAQEYLQMFFSPKRIPIGLTDNQISICIRLYPYRKRMIEKLAEIEDAKLKKYKYPSNPRPTLQDALELLEEGFNGTCSEAEEYLDYVWRIIECFKRPIRTPPYLPSYLGHEVEMTKERFRLGVSQFINQYRNLFPS